MNLLLDTHAVLWAISEPESLPGRVQDCILSSSHDVHVSSVSAWEIAVKQSLGKLNIPAPAEQWLPEGVALSGYGWIPIAHEDALRVRTLPWHHRDPFDRLLVAQAMGGYTLVSADPRMADYPIEVLWE